MWGSWDSFTFEGMALPDETSLLEDGEPWVPEDTFGARLALIRQRMSWNVKEAAEACGLTGQSWHNWENGSLPRDLYKTVTLIADAAGCDRTWLLMGGPIGKKWTKNMGPDLEVLDGEGEDPIPGPGQLPLPFPTRLRLVD